MAEHRVAVVVFCTVDVVDELDARCIAERAVKQAVRTAGLDPASDGTRTILCRVRPADDPIPVAVHEVHDVITAALNGYLALRVTNRAYPREEETSD